MSDSFCPPVLVHDPLRLAALAGYGILDTAPEQGFDDIVQLARQLCGAPVALVSLVAGDRQWFKARVGFPRDETGLDASVCAHALGEPDLLVIPNLATDPRTRANPLVTGEPFIQFYAGAPLRTPEGQVLGSLCVLDHRPRPEGLSEARCEALRALARQVVTLLELRRQQSMLQTVTDHVGQAIFRMDRAGTVTFINPATETMFGWPAADLIGRSLRDTVRRGVADGRVFPPEHCPLWQALLTGRLVENHEDTFFRRDGTPVQVLVTNAPITLAGGITGTVMTVGDVTAISRTQRALRETQRFTTALLELGDGMRDLSQVADMTYAAAGIVGRALGASRVGFGRFDPTGSTVTVERDWTEPGQISIAGRYPFEDYSGAQPDLRAGRPLIVDDVRQDPRTAAHAAALLAVEAQALVNMPVREHGRTATLFFVHDRQPRPWSEGEISFLQAVADRVETGIARLYAEEHQHLLNRELSHRMKNLLAMVQAIATQTMRNATDVKEAQNVLTARLIALGRAHDLLMGGALTSTEMEPVIRAATDIHADRPDRFRIEGPPIVIGTDQALSLALMLHELATNALKYGALSSDGGHVAITWEVSPAEQGPLLSLTWAEAGGPAVMPPARKGFGTRLIERGLSAQVGGTLALDYPPSGVTCRICAPLADFQAGH